ncbi:IclR family transcriptional regulator [Fodinicola feengrottensis]|uniref:IclR family transcriptional regulator n=1 Tax=Fodinicola feengrottensis TaxID=435914 RepID=UPI0024410473|nr:IclR family transcriptional regulator [Fodinicola feengrottensis]
MQSVDRAVTVLELVAKHGEAGITEIATELGVHKSTVSRLLSVLESRGMVEQLGDRGKYVIGFGIVRLAGAATGRIDVARLGQVSCQELADQLGETVNIAILDEDSAINITQAHGSAAVSAQNWIGQRTPLHATSSGKVLLAHMPVDRRRRLLRRKLEEFTPRTITDADQLKQELERVVSDGYATCFEELELGMHAVAAPVLGQRGEIVGAISASGPAYRLPRRRIRQVADELAEVAGQLSEQLGYLA